MVSTIISEEGCNLLVNLRKTMCTVFLPPPGGVTPLLDCKKVVFFPQNQYKKKVMCDVRVLRARSARASQGRRERKNGIFSVSPQSGSLFSASFQTFCLTARAYLNTQKYGLFCSLLPYISYIGMCHPLGQGFCSFWSGIRYMVFEGTTGVHERIYRVNSK